MDTKTAKLNFRHGAFRDSIRAYREYKKDWQARMEVKLAQMEEEIRQAKADTFYKVEAI